MKNSSIPFEAGKYYHIYNRGNNRELLFKENQNFTYFLELTKKYLIPIADIYTYSLLPTHFHFIIKINEINKLPISFRTGKTKLHQAFSNMFNTYAKAINKKYQRRGSLFQEHLKRIEIKDESYLRNLIIYVNTNASHHDVDDYVTYPHASYQALVSEKPTLLKRNEVIHLFDDKENFIFVHRLKKINIDLIKYLTFE